jgi:hypothetical protein
MYHSLKVTDTAPPDIYITIKYGLKKGQHIYQEQIFTVDKRVNNDQFFD